MKHISATRLSLILLLALGSCLIAQEDAGLTSIETEDIRARIGFLANDLLQGRDTPSRGLDIAALYAASLFEAWGLHPLPGREEAAHPYHLPVSLMEKELQEGNSIRINGNAYGEADGFAPLLMRDIPGPGAVEAGVVFAGYGRRFSAEGFNEFGGLDVKGRFVLIMEKEPQTAAWKQMTATEVAEGDIRSYNAAVRHAARNGARGVIRIGAEETEEETRRRKFWLRRLKLSLAGNQEEEVFLHYNLTPSLASTLLAELGLDLAAAQKSLAEKKEPVSKALEGTITIEVDSKVELLTVHNVAAMIPGSDPVLKHEYVLIGAHLDHVGSREGFIWNGADDNASGSAAVLELAQAFSLLPEKPKRSLIVALWTGEERGLLGSRYFAANLPVAREALTSYLNLDMVGRDLTVDSVRTTASRFGFDIKTEWLADDYLKRGLIVYTSQSAPLMLESLTAANEATESLNLLHIFTNQRSGGSDHTAFERIGVPVAGFFTGFHEDYHQHTDTSEKINFAKAAQITRVVYQTALLLANN